MRPIDSAYDRDTAEQRSDDPGAREYALVSDHNGPCSIVADYGSLSDAIEAARAMDTDAAPTDLEDEIDYDSWGDCDDSGLIAAAQEAGWRVVASAPAGEYWTVLTQLDPTQYAYDAGAEYCRQVASDPINHQDGPGKFGEHDAIPDSDYVDMRQRFGSVTREMERAYRRGYNDTAAG